jgi:hypothetical protein
MAGSYCKFCDTRCFVPRVIPDGPKEGTSLHLATCQPGMDYDLGQTGHTHITALNPVTEPEAVAELARQLDGGEQEIEL